MAFARYLDTYELARSCATVEGVASLPEFCRLCEGLPEQTDRPVEWSVEASKNTSGEVFLTVNVKTAVVLECQRCLGPYLEPIDVSTRLQVVSEAALEDGGSHDLEGGGALVERIAASHRLDVLELVEDEIILGLPYVPKHEVCPSEPAPPAEPEPVGKRPSPFSVLGKLKN